MAPEVLSRKHKEYGLEADWWMLGACLFEMLTGAPPFKRKSVNRTKTAIQKEELVWPEECSERLTDDATDFVEGLLEKDPEMRLTGVGAKAHLWMDGVDWAAVERRNAPSPARRLLSSSAAAAPEASIAVADGEHGEVTVTRTVAGGEVLTSTGLYEWHNSDSEDEEDDAGGNSSDEDFDYGERASRRRRRRCPLLARPPVRPPAHGGFSAAQMRSISLYGQVSPKHSARKAWRHAPLALRSVKQAAAALTGANDRDSLYRRLTSTPSTPRCSSILWR